LPLDARPRPGPGPLVRPHEGIATVDIQTALKQGLKKTINKIMSLCFGCPMTVCSMDGHGATH
jgi:hypothetical protein